MRGNILSFSLKFIIALAVLAVSLAAAMLFGAAQVSPADVLGALSGDTGKNSLLLRELRFPRELAALFVGAALAVSGAVMQGMTRNPLADPGLLGLTAGANAALAVAFAVMPDITTAGIMIACFLGAAAGAGIVFGIAAVKRGGFSPFRLVLAGAAVSAFFFAAAQGIGLLFNVSKDISMWTAGGVIGTTWAQLRIIGPVVLIAIAVSLCLARQLTLLSLSDEVAVGLGQNTLRVKSALFVLIIILAGSAVALAGNLAFVGLMIPHITRAVVGTDYRFVLPMSAVAGGAFMLLADTVSRTMNAPYETPLAALVAVIGLPFFLIIVRKGGRAFT
ncbi:ferrichrome ABC transporter permease [Sporosarcina sp. NCCP-2716]|uniref:FecCD family ABC transporter permease n=1 Tax=Sporosarcina sp. NCCP-2716 TaxID=2943679 RepID=UPI002040D516|nr:iron ABC transporter permease [Sporosarcina sp. NCCP-2716]GKV68164.1 ferrichrome ABC transporter permease [Sporosarcina sp. NCCP-2716]